VLDYFPVLRERFDGPAGKLSGGEQQQLAIARALLSKPRLLMLDEPSLGLAPLVIAQVYEILERLNRDGLAVLLVEQSANRAIAAAARGYVLRNGRVELEGESQQLARDPAFERAYFGFAATP
jgi:branched-chain amino acid transport system ATP-binding protein